MKFRLIETDKERTDGDIALDIILRDCKPFLKLAKEYPLSLLHGVDTDGWEDHNNLANFVKVGKNRMYIKKVRSSRKPKDTTGKISGMMNRFLNKYYNLGTWMPRSQSKFFTGSYSEVSNYGDTFKAFPIGNFQFMWSSNIVDPWMSYTDRFERDFSTEDYRNFKKALNGEEIRQDSDIDMAIIRFTDFMRTYKTNDLRGAIKSGSEIMIGPAGTRFYLIDAEFSDEVRKAYHKRFKNKKVFV